VFCLFYLSRPVEEAKMDEPHSSSSISSCLHPHFPSLKRCFHFPHGFFFNYFLFPSLYIKSLDCPFCVCALSRFRIIFVYFFLKTLLRKKPKDTLTQLKLGFAIEDEFPWESYDPFFLIALLCVMRKSCNTRNGEEEGRK
jgi:hypothetical protein